MQIKNFKLNSGTYIEPYRYKMKILSYGDSITQGYDALFPSYSYINRFSMYLDAFIYNKAIGGDIFRPALIERKNFKPDIVTIAYGTNDWSKCTKADFMSFLTTLHYGPDMHITSTFIPTLPGKLFYLKELAGPLTAECN